MMRKLLIALGLLAGMESAAMACSCMPPPQDRAQMRDLANELAGGAVALVEVDVRSGFNARTRRGELLRVRQTLAGRAARDFRLARRGPPSGAMCDVEYQAGSRGLMLLYRADRPIVRGQRQYRDGGLCASILLQNAELRQMVIEAMQNRRTMGQNDASPFAPPCGSAA